LAGGERRQTSGDTDAKSQKAFGGNLSGHADDGSLGMRNTRESAGGTCLEGSRSDVVSREYDAKEGGRVPIAYE